MALSDSEYPILYSARDCPFCIRARIALYKAGIAVALREIDLQQRPDALYKASKKGTVPVLVLPNDKVIDESMAIILWALNQNDPAQWLVADKDEIDRLVDLNDTKFKAALKGYRKDPQDIQAREAGHEILNGLEIMLRDQRYLLGGAITIADLALFPFVQKFIKVDQPWANAQELSRVHQWLADLADSPLYNAVMGEFPPWEEGDTPILLAPLNPRAA